MIKTAILSLSLLTVMSGAAVAPALADIIAAFPGTPETAGKMVLTVPALTIIPTALLTGYLSRFFSRKTLVYAGLALYLAGGAGGGLADSISVLLVMRGVLGLGVGILMPLSTGIIGDLYSGEEKARIMGYSSASSNLGGILATLVSGFLAVMHWRASFSVYLLAVPVLFLVIFFVPDNKAEQTEKTPAVPLSEYLRYSLWGLAMFFVMSVFYTYPVNMALHISQAGLGDAGTAGAVISVLPGSSFVAGLFFGRLRRSLKNYLPAAGLASCAFSFFLLAEYPDIFTVTAAMVLGGFTVGSIVPFIMNGVTTGVTGSNATAATSVVSSFLFAGQFASPVITAKAAQVMTGEGIPAIFEMLYTVLAAVFGIYLISVLIINLSVRSKGGKNEK